MQTRAARSDCATCRDRAISCDRTRPHCANCFRSNRKCQGYDLRLSWPRANDRRRAVVSKWSPPCPGQITNGRFVHTSHWDIELSQNLTSPGPARNSRLLYSPSFWNPSKLETLDADLLENFYCVACESLATFGHDATLLGSILVRIALEGETASAAAVLQALLAFSSLHRHGLQSQAVELKIAALGSLAQGPFALSLGSKETIQHIAAGMLLCSFEIHHQSPCTSGQWTRYLGGVKTVIKASSIKALLQFGGSDVALLLDWVYYHDVLARFSLRHWRREGTEDIPPTLPDVFYPEISNLPPPISSMLNGLSQICDTVSSSAIPPEMSVDDYKSFLEVLDWRIRKLPIPKITDDSDAAALVMKLYQLAMLLYLNRSSEGRIDQPIRAQHQIDQAFSIIPRLTSCKQQFPIFVIGCEARTDEQRAVVLDIISRTENMSPSRSFNHCKGLLQAVWAQDDLAQWNTISYHHKLRSVMSHCVITPSFV